MPWAAVVLLNEIVELTPVLAVVIGAATVIPVSVDESVAAEAPPMVTPLVPATPGLVPRAPVLPRVKVPELRMVEPV